MKLVLCVALLAGAAFGPAAAGKATPVEKVIELLKGMAEKGKSEKHKEQVQFAAYKQWCEDIVAEKTNAIEEANEMITMLKADIQKYASDAAELGAQIAAHQEDISVWNGDKNAATKVREIEKQAYDALHKDYTESVDALNMAIAVLKKQAHDRPQASLIQLSKLKDLRLIPTASKRVIDTYLQQSGEAPEGLDVSAPSANAYEFQSQGVIDMLNKLLDKFIDERTTLEKTEMTSVEEYELLMQDLNRQVAQAEKDEAEKQEAKAKRLQSKADAEGDLTDTTTTRDADVKYLSDTTATCEQKASDFEHRQLLRAEELQAIAQAVEIISSAALKGNAEKHLPALLQFTPLHPWGVMTALAQLRTDTISPVQVHVAQYLEDRARQLNSRVLSTLAVHVKSDPFKKVKKMIKDLITRLMEEANEEATHKGWCDQELSTNAQTRKEKTVKVQTLHAEIDELETSIAKLMEEIAEITQQVADLDEAMAKATGLREAEKAKNMETIEDSRDAQVAVSQALTVLKEFYAKAAEATALAQLQQPAIFDSAYQGMQGEGGGVISMLEVINSDFARLEADTNSAEATAQKEYDQFMTDSKVDRAAKVKDIEHKTAKKQDQTQALGSKRADLEGTQKELDAALDYFDKLKPSCIGEEVSFEDRVARRKEEIESLQQALRILNGEDMA